MDYTKASDFEINKAVAIKICKKEDDGSDYMGFFLSDLMDNTPNYCNDPAAMWPIIVENNIVVTPCMGSNEGDVIRYFEHRNPVRICFEENSQALRAAAIVYLMMEN